MMNEQDKLKEMRRIVLNALDSFQQFRGLAVDTNFVRDIEKLIRLTKLLSHKIDFDEAMFFGEGFEAEE